MDWVELHNVEFGDCTVLGGNGQMLMVDCGSLNSMLGKGACKFEEYAKRLTKRYAPIEQRHGMISHFHKDHVNGFATICSSNVFICLLHHRTTTEILFCWNLPCWFIHL